MTVCYLCGESTGIYCEECSRPICKNHWIEVHSNGSGIDGWESDVIGYICKSSACEYPTPEEESEFVADILGDAYTEDQLGDLPEEFDFENGYINILRNKFQKKELSLVEYLNMLEQFCLKVEEMVKENTGHPCRVEIVFYGHYEPNRTMFDDTEGFGSVHEASNDPSCKWRMGESEKVIVHNDE